jgi:hypothetical protein
MICVFFNLNSHSFFSDQKEGNCSIVHIPEVSYNLFLNLMEMLYTGRLKNMQSEVINSLFRILIVSMPLTFLFFILLFPLMIDCFTIDGFV